MRHLRRDFYRFSVRLGSAWDVGARQRAGTALERGLDATLAALLLVLLVPLAVFLALAIKIDSRGPLLFRCRRVGLGGRDFDMLKFRKMVDGAGGPALTASDDVRFTGMGRFLARTKLDEFPQLWNVLRGEMSFVGPRPEDPIFVAAHRDVYQRILQVRPGVTGLSQLAFARESEILDPKDPTGHYVHEVLPQKIGMDQLYVDLRSFAEDLRILAWTVAAIVFRREVAVQRGTGRLSVRRRPSPELTTVALD